MSGVVYNLGLIIFMLSTQYLGLHGGPGANTTLGGGDAEVTTRTPYPIPIKTASCLSASHTEVLHTVSQEEPRLNEKCETTTYPCSVVCQLYVTSAKSVCWPM